MKKPIIIAKLGKTHGVKGWLRVNSMTDPKKNIFNYPNWQLKTQHLKPEWQPLNIEEHKFHGDNILIKLKNIDNPEDASKYTNLEIAVERDDLPPPNKDEIYWTDLEGLTVINLKDVELGKLEFLFNSGSNDIMVVQGKRKHLIPYLKSVIHKIDMENNKMIVDWDEDF